MKSKHEVDASTISGWEARGGEPDSSGQSHQYGRRFEGDGTYTIYHVFSGNVATIGAWKMNGLSPKNAARALRVLNNPLGGVKK